MNDAPVPRAPSPFSSPFSPFAQSSSEFGPSTPPSEESDLPCPPSRAASMGDRLHGRPPLPVLRSLSTPDPQRALQTQLSRQSSAPSAAGSKKAPSQLWRTSTAVSDKVASALGLTSLADLCGTSYIPQDSLKKVKALGEGAFAEVEVAKLVTPPEAGAPVAAGACVAVKRLKPNVLECEDDVFSFVAEARLLLALRHPSIIQYIGIGCADASIPEAQWRTMYLVQEFAEHGTLKKVVLNQMITPGRKLYSLADAVRWGKQMAQGLAYLHGCSPMVIHRDLKTENVLLVSGQGGRMDAKLADFGLHTLVKRPAAALPAIEDIKEEECHHGLALAADAARSPTAADAEAQRQGIADARQAKYHLTGQTGAYIYMAPEVLQGKPYNEKVDCFGFGVILYELLHRKMLLADIMYLGGADDAQAHAHKVAAGYRPPISEALPQGLRQLVKECQSGTPELRPSMEEVVRRMEEVERSGELQAAEQAHGPKGSQAGCCTIM